jgi:uncharacterized membrane protein
METNMHESEMASNDPDLPFKLVGGLSAASFIGAFVCDLVYVGSPDSTWVTFSIWLITFGLIVAGIATLFGFLDRLWRRQLRPLGALWPYLVGFAAVVIVSIFNAFVHSRDAYEAVVPDGLILSFVAVALLVLTPIVARAVIRSRSKEASL